MKREHFNIKAARNIPIDEVLNDMGYSPIKIANNNRWYLSPFRKETHPSFKVNMALNRWYDFGEQIGGNIIDLIIQIYGLSCKEALEHLSKYVSLDTFSFQRPIIEESGITLLKVQPIEHPAIIEYLESRKIKPFAYNAYCKEVYYSINGKKYFAVGFENESKGYELRSKFFKGCIIKKDITHIKNNSTRLLIFEGFTDFLSFLSIGNEHSIKSYDTIILNSVGNAKKVYSLLKSYQTIYSYLDNDKAGDRCTDELIKEANNIVDCREAYTEFKDFNEYLINQ
ncbi:toprim domain-containing protein [Dysgonomonas sp. ZJ279]|uniref:toprim domain-containing protein n=1 Tax=Dysgonomonas sp. ZJ279 TaxID=2709796 RepID=UPI0013EDA590|nr:toprim domain-containing protein [Dysgonomonas sp. ZJ279]